MDDLVRGLQAGRPEAFERLVREFGDRVYRVLKRLTGERWAEDLTQEVFLRVHRSVGEWRPEARFEAWLFSIANHVGIDHLRRNRPMADLGEPGRFAALDREPSELLEDEERRKALMDAVEQLPFEQKRVFVLREDAGLSFKEIAELTKCPLNTALSRMHGAMESLRKTLKSHGMR